MNLMGFQRPEGDGFILWWGSVEGKGQQGKISVGVPLQGRIVWAWLT